MHCPIQPTLVPSTHSTQPNPPARTLRDPNRAGEMSVFACVCFPPPPLENGEERVACPQAWLLCTPQYEGRREQKKAPIKDRVATIGWFQLFFTLQGLIILCGLCLTYVGRAKTNIFCRLETSMGALFFSPPPFPVTFPPPPSDGKRRGKNRDRNWASNGGRKQEGRKRSPLKVISLISPPPPSPPRFLRGERRNARFISWYRSILQNSRPNYVFKRLSKKQGERLHVGFFCFFKLLFL